MVKTTSGFTIVELLIVIVVIGILAAITIVAYNGVQQRASDAVVQTDVRNFYQKVQEHKTIEGSFPAGGGTNAAYASLSKFRLGRASYDTSIHNFVYCRGIVDGVDTAAVAAGSISGTRYTYHSVTGPQEHSSSWGSVAAACGSLGIPSSTPSYSFTFGYNRGGLGTWYAWTE